MVDPVMAAVVAGAAFELVGEAADLLGEADFEWATEFGESLLEHVEGGGELAANALSGLVAMVRIGKPIGEFAARFGADPPETGDSLAARARALVALGHVVSSGAVASGQLAEVQGAIEELRIEAGARSRVQTRVALELGDILTDEPLRALEAAEVARVRLGAARLPERTPTPLENLNLSADVRALLLGEPTDLPGLRLYIGVRRKLESELTCIMDARVKAAANAPRLAQLRALAEEAREQSRSGEAASEEAAQKLTSKLIPALHLSLRDQAEAGKTLAADAKNALTLLQREIAELEEHEDLDEELSDRLEEELFPAIEAWIVDHYGLGEAIEEEAQRLDAERQAHVQEVEKRKAGRWAWSPMKLWDSISLATSSWGTDGDLQRFRQRQVERVCPGAYELDGPDLSCLLLVVLPLCTAGVEPTAE